MEVFDDDPDGSDARDGPGWFGDPYPGPDPGPGEVPVPGVAETLALLEAGLGSLSDTELRDVLSGVERMTRRLQAVQVDVIDEIDRRGLHNLDGHASAKVMARHVCQLSDSEAGAREKVRRALRELPGVADAYRAGEIGTCQVRLIGRVYANGRASDALADQDDDLATQAAARSYDSFSSLLRSWERLVDQDGTADRNERNHRNRDARLIQDPFGLGWDLEATFGALQGAQMREIFDRYIEAEWHHDWEQARAQHGDAATIADLPRSDAQRRADALAKIFADAASRKPGGTGPETIHNIVWDADSYLEMLAKLDPNAVAEWADPHDDGDEALDLLDAEKLCCETMDGVPLEPVEAAGASLADSVRRVLIDAAGVVIDLGRKSRLFTGSARTAAQLQARHCIWPGCRVPTTHCDIDHVKPGAQGGRTSPENGIPLCGRHNRWKQKGFTTWRDPAGAWHTYRPDGSEIL